MQSRNNYTEHPEYDKLPEPIKILYTPKEYAWLSDAEKADLVTRECMPDWEDE